MYISVYFAVPGKVEELILKPGSKNISVTWKKPIVNSYCVSNYIIYWVNFLHGSVDSSIVSKDRNSFLIEELDACLDYEILMIAMNEKPEVSNLTTASTTTETDGNYHNIISLYCSSVCTFNRYKLMMSCFSNWIFN
jgi:hypothetical protein